MTDQAAPTSTEGKPGTLARLARLNDKDERENMSKPTRGAPKKYGMKRPGELMRAGALVQAYNRARLSGQTDRRAKKTAMDEVRGLMPEERLSESTVDRALKWFQPSGDHEVFMFKFDKTTPTDPFFESWFRDVPFQHLAVGVGPQPKYPKHRKGRILQFNRRK